MVDQGQKDFKYRIRLYPIDAETDEIEWIAEIPELPGCIGAGDTPEEALAMLKDAYQAWIAVAAEDNRPIPGPTKLYNTEYSGKFTLRLPKSLHRELAIQAEEEGVSLNQYILYLIGKGMDKSEISVASEPLKTYKRLNSNKHLPPSCSTPISS
ncbi:MAG: type II toxin-antitoxin system HicB family antitoxin [Bacillota bacterium]